MNILYLSHLSGAAYAGPTYSVPKQIEAQSKIDNVFWYNATTGGKKEWKELPFYHDILEFPDESIYKLPEPFNHPDLIVVELFYNMTRSNLRRELVKGDIPYIIIPRGELTAQAQCRKKIKKSIANLLICKRFAKKATAIHYLTEQEYKDSGDLWNPCHLIIPNGIDKPACKKVRYSNNSIKFISIGRIEPYQKGLDLLIAACKQSETFLRKTNVVINICGPDKENKLQSLKEIVEKEGLNDIIVFHDALYGDEKVKILLDSDIFLMPSRFEGHPMALIEALSYGLPCVVTTGSNMREEIDAYDAGWTADNDDSSITKALIKAVNDFQNINLRQKKSNNAILLSQKYLWDEIAQETVKMYSEFYRQCKNK